MATSQLQRWPTPEDIKKASSDCVPNMHEKTNERQQQENFYSQQAQNGQTREVPEIRHGAAGHTWHGVRMFKLS